jgi:general secretion pathway protein B
MSYILDALKRADAERERGAVPGLHTQQWPNTASAAPASASSRLWLLLATAVVLVALAVGLWLWRTPAPVPQVATAPMALAAAPTAMPAPAVAPAAAKPEALPTPTTPVAKAVPAAPPPANKASAQPVAPLPTPVVAPVPLLSELPEAFRSQIPALTITGTVYSDNPALRLWLVNNQVLPQGSTVAAGVTLEEIRPRSSTFSFLGTRFRLAH